MKKLKKKSVQKYQGLIPEYNLNNCSIPIKRKWAQEGQNMCDDIEAEGKENKLEIATMYMQHDLGIIV